jgi:hypothetical protein
VAREPRTEMRKTIIFKVVPYLMLHVLNCVSYKMIKKLKVSWNTKHLQLNPSLNKSCKLASRTLTAGEAEAEAMPAACAEQLIFIQRCNRHKDNVEHYISFYARTFRSRHAK